MKKLYRVARISANKIKKEDCLKLSEDQALRIASHCIIRKEGYALDEEILSELLAFHISRTDRFALIALLIDVRKGFQIVVFV